MTGTASPSWNRRDFLGVAALVALAAGLPAAAVRLSELPDDEAPSEALRALLREVSQLVLPRTGTPGAGEVGTGDFVLLALAHGLEGARAPNAGAALPAFASFARPDGSLRHADWLEHELNRRAGGNFLAAPGRASLLAALDVEAFAEGVGAHPWRTIKALILTGYYTSETGGAQELRYELVPGRWDADLPATPATVAYSSDWTAVDFG
ncbi:gluconate 2-dehydrogenase subunit 3 family protein [Novosphingobium flavum]|uniref:gluconate 2-dehydrogenase subunit 3 family protein n=1 Tax=Novosphingobium flavum TaxID=1778672 RepID=UPI0031B6458B